MSWRIRNARQKEKTYIGILNLADVQGRSQSALVEKPDCVGWGTAIIGGGRGELGVTTIRRPTDPEKHHPHADIPSLPKELRWF